VQADQRSPTFFGVVAGLTGAVAGLSAASEAAPPSHGPLVLMLSGVLAAAFAWQRWRVLHTGIALVGEAIERLLVPEEELDEEGRKGVALAERECRTHFPRLARLLDEALARDTAAQQEPSASAAGVSGAQVGARDADSGERRSDVD
jgi:hypothetical protein